MNAVVDRVVQYPHRYQLRNVNTGEVLGTFDLEPITGTISVVGTKIDKALFDSIASDISARLVSNGGDAKDNIVTYSMASNRSNIASGEKLSVSFGKIAKYFNDLKAVAFSGSKADIGLGNVDNTSDANKPVSNATQQALNNKANASDVYSKTETDGLLNNKANTNDVYSKTKTDELLNNKANKSDVYTKTETDGLLNDKANASETDNKINKPLYNLGAYDTISGNVITRQTGYLNGKDYLSKTISKNGVNNPYLTIDNIYVDYIENIIGNCNRVDTNSWWNSTFSQVTISYDSTYKFLVIMLPNGATDTSSLNNISIQYKLATPYTEEIIEGQPLITLDQQGSQWLRDEWGKGLNVLNTFDRSNIPSTSSLYNATLNSDGSYTSTATHDGRQWNYSNSDFKLHLTKGKYCLSGMGTISTGRTLTIEMYDSNNKLIVSVSSENNYKASFTLTSDTDVGIITKLYDGSNVKIMLNEGDHPYPYQAYNGEIVHDKDIADLYKQEYNLGYYDTMVENSDGRYTITRQTGYVDLGKLHWIYDPNNNQFYSNEIVNAYSENNTWIPVVCNTYTYNIVDYNDLPTPHIRGFFDKRLYVVDETLNRNGELITGVIQYKLATATTEKVEKNHYARYNQDFILEHNKSEAERSANLFDDNGTNSIQYIGHLYTNDSNYNYDLSPHDNYNCFRIRVEQNKTYYIKEINGLILRFEDINNNLVGGLSLLNTGYGAFTTPNGCKYVVFSKAINLATNVTMLNEGSVALPYQAYEGKVVHEKELESITPGIFTKLGNKTNFSFDSGSYLVVANNGMVTVTGTDPLNVGSSAFKKYLGVFMVTIAEYDGGQSLRVNTEQVFFADYVSGTISGSRFTIYKLN